jgi:TonB family protein
MNPATTRDSERTPLAFGLAVGLHVLVAIYLMFYFWTHRAPMTMATEQVFELVSSPSSASASSPSPNPAPTPSHASASITAPPLPPIAKMPPLPPPPHNTPSTPSPPKPVPPPPPTPTAMTQTTTTPATTKPMTYAQYLMEHPLSTAPTQPSHAQTTPRAVPKVGLSDASILNQLTKMEASSPSAQTGPAGKASTSDYIASLRARLQAAYESPPGLNDPSLSALVQITIDADGRVTGRRLVKSSGNAAYDEAVVEALARVTSVDPPPGGAQTFPFNFQNNMTQ